MNKINSNVSPSTYHYISDDRKILKSTAKKFKQALNNDSAKNAIAKKEMVKQIKGALSRLGIKIDNAKNSNVWAGHVT